MLKKTALALAVSTLFVGAAQASTTIYKNDNGDTLKLYGEVGVGGYFGPDYEYGNFYQSPIADNKKGYGYDVDKSYIDNSSATVGLKGNYQETYYRFEVDYERENWNGGSGDMALMIDKVFIGYKLTPNHAIEFGLTDTAFDDYDNYGDYTFKTGVETGEAGDQANTIKYEGNVGKIKMGTSFSYQGESSSGAALGNVVNGYVGYFGDFFSAVVGVEKREGSEGESKYGEQQLVGFGVRVNVNEKLAIGLNGFIEAEDIAQNSIVIKNPVLSGKLQEQVKVYNNYETEKNKGYLISGRYKLMPKWELTGSYNYEEYEKWEKHNNQYGKLDKSWGDERTWTTVGVNFRPTSSVVFAIEANFGEAAQDAYGFARVYF